MMFLGMPIPFPTNVTPATQTASGWWLFAVIAIMVVAVAVLMTIAVVTGKRSEGTTPHEAHGVDETDVTIRHAA